MTCWKRISEPGEGRTTVCWRSQHGLVWTTMGTRERYAGSPVREHMQHTWVPPHKFVGALGFHTCSLLQYVSRAD